ncbi:hypothetical protein C825_000023 [Parabacteroides sp. ASF519]|nr:hypothetical protein C825_000023 [Parabacteroides sp. ASF519]
MTRWANAVWLRPRSKNRTVCFFISECLNVILSLIYKAKDRFSSYKQLVWVWYYSVFILFYCLLWGLTDILSFSCLLPLNLIPVVEYFDGWLLLPRLVYRLEDSIIFSADVYRCL